MILVPSTWPQWEARKLRAVLAHELSHVARHDALMQALAKFHRCVFWFSPLSGWLEHHLAELAEQASDDAALRAVSDRTYYAEILLGFLAALEGAQGRIHWQGVSMAKGANVHRRVDHILTPRTALVRAWKKPVWAGALLMAVPLVCLAAAVRPEVRRPSPSLMSGAMPVRAAAPAAAIGAVPKAGLELAALGYGAQQAPAPPAPAAAPSAPGPRPAPAARPASAAAPAQPIPPSGKPQPPSPSNAFHWANYSDDYQDGEAYAIVSGDSISMSGGPADMRHAKSLQNKITGDYIWFRHDGKGYVIRDAATVRRAKELLAPQEALGGQQEDLGKKQEELGRQQEALGKKMEEVRIKIPDMSAELKSLEQQLAKLRAGGTMQELGEVQSALGELQSRLGELQGQAGAQQGKLGAMQGELGRQQGELGAQQGRLGAEQGRLAREATRKMRTLLDEALKNGVAQPE